MKKSPEKLSTDDLVRIYALRLMGMKGREIKVELGMPHIVPTLIFNRLVNMKNGKWGKKRYKNYVEAIKIIKARYPSIAKVSRSELLNAPLQKDDVIVVQQNTTTTRFYDLMNAQETFMKAVIVFIDSEVGVIKQENEQLRAAIGDNKTANWIKNLQEKYAR